MAGEDVAVTGDWITTTQAAEFSGYHAEYLRTLVREGKVKGQKFGPIWQVSKKSLQEYLERAMGLKDRRHGPHQS